MAVKYHDRVAETTTTSGTGSLTLGGALSLHRSFSVVGNGNSCAFLIEDADGVNWEVSLGVWSTGGTLTRATTLSSSTGSKLNLSSGTHNVRLVWDAASAQTVWDAVASLGSAAYLPATSFASISTGTFATRPAAGTSNRLYLASDSPIASYDNGSAWLPFGPVHRFIDPTLQTFSWVNQGTSTVSTTRGGIVMIPQSSASMSYRLQVKSAPATPYTITAAMMGMGMTTGWQMGLFFRDSASGKLVNLAMGITTQMLLVTQKWDSPTGSVAGYVSYDTAIVGIHPSLAWLRITDDGSNRISSISPNGTDWIQIHSVGRTDYLTADQVGFGMFNQNTTASSVLHLLSWEES